MCTVTLNFHTSENGRSLALIMEVLKVTEGIPYVDLVFVCLLSYQPADDDDDDDVNAFEHCFV